MTKTLLLLPGDGIGPEVTMIARRVAGRLINQGLDLVITEALFGGASIDVHGVPLTDAVLARARAADAVLMGAVGGPAWAAAPALTDHTRTPGLAQHPPVGVGAHHHEAVAGLVLLAHRKGHQGAGVAGEEVAAARRHALPRLPLRQLLKARRQQALPSLLHGVPLGHRGVQVGEKVGRYRLVGDRGGPAAAGHWELLLGGSGCAYVRPGSCRSQGGAAKGQPVAGRRSCLWALMANRWAAKHERPHCGVQAGHRGSGAIGAAETGRAE